MNDLRYNPLQRRGRGSHHTSFVNPEEYREKPARSAVKRCKATRLSSSYLGQTVFYSRVGEKSDMQKSTIRLLAITMCVLSLSLANESFAQSSSRGSSSRGAARRPSPGAHGRRGYAPNRRMPGPSQAAATGLLNGAPRPGSAGPSSRSSFRPSSSGVAVSSSVGLARPTSPTKRSKRSPLSTRPKASSTKAMPRSTYNGPSLPQTSPLVERTWTSGSHRTVARLIAYQNGIVWLRKSDGGLAKLPLSILSQDDQNLVRTSQLK